MGIGLPVILITALALCTLGVPLSAHAQHAEKVYRIGLLSEASPPAPLAPYSSPIAFRQSMLRWATRRAETWPSVTRRSR